VALRPFMILVRSLWLQVRPIRIMVEKLWPIWAVWALWGVLIYSAAYYEGVLWLPDSGRGLLEHYSFWASFLIGPIIITATYHARNYFLQFAVDAVERHTSISGKELIRNEIKSLAKRSQGAFSFSFWLALFGIAGINFSIRTYGKLFYPLDYWGNDVFNAHAYPVSSIAANGYLFTLWSVVYPLSAVFLIQTALSVQRVPLEAIRQDLLELDLLHPDGCAGLVRFGNLNLGLMSMFFLPAIPILLLYFTHEQQNLSVLGISIIFLTIVLLLAFVGLWPIARLIRSKRDSAIDSWNDKIRRLVTTRQLGSTEALVALEYRECLMAVRSFPYEKFVVHIFSVLQLTLALLVILGVTESKSERLSTNSFEAPSR
jgi:hypothetical protein